MLYRHLKTNRIYRLMQTIINKTNDKEMILYMNVKNGILYVRDSDDFYSKFKRIDLE